MTALISGDTIGTIRSDALALAFNRPHPRFMSAQLARQIVSRTATNDSYSWTGHGNGTTSYTVNGLNQRARRQSGGLPRTALATVSGAAAAHDARGNMTTDPATGRSYSYWSSDNQLLRVSSPWTVYGYDPLSRLAYIETGTPVTNFAYDGLEALAEYDQNNIGARRTPREPQRIRFCSTVGKSASEGLYDFGTSLTDKASYVIAGGLMARSPQLIAVGEISAILGTGLQALGATGRLVSTGNVTRARYDAIGIAFSFFQSQSRAGQLALGYTGGKSVELRTELTPGMDC